MLPEDLSEEETRYVLAQLKLEKLEWVPPHAAMMVLRVRAGKNRAQLAREIGVKRTDLIGMELGQKPYSRLSDYWRSTP